MKRKKLMPDACPLMPPIIVLSRPQMGENIGAAARVMANFGLSELRLVAPRDGWPNPSAGAMAAGGAHLIASATLYDTAQEAVADCQRVLATTSRERAMMRPVLTPRGAFVRDCEAGESRRGNPSVGGAQEDGLSHGVAARNDSIKTAILFGCEKSGLDNDEVALAEAVLSIPVSPDCASLNLAMAVGVVAYEWFQASQASDVRHQQSGISSQASAHEPAPQAELQGLFDQIEAALDERNFWKEPKKKPVMWRNLRGVFLRARPSAQEVRTLRGMIRCLTDY